MILVTPLTLVALALPLLVTLAPAPPLTPAAREGAWRPPVTPIIVERAFMAPAGAYAPGHRGVDLRADPGSVVRAPAPGVVRVAGQVAGKAVVSIDHPHRILGRTGWRTTYEGVLAGVDVGDSVDVGDPLGVVITHAHTSGIHWGLKNGRVYADPMLLLRRVIVLKPLVLQPDMDLGRPPRGTAPDRLPSRLVAAPAVTR